MCCLGQTRDFKTSACISCLILDAAVCRMRTVTLFALIVLTLLTGCATPENIPLSDDGAVSALQKKDIIAPPVKPNLSDSERQEVEIEVFSWLLDRPIGDDPVYSAIFLQVDPPTTTILMRQFPAHQPPLKPLWHISVRPGQSPLDKDTGQPAVILSVDMLDPENGTLVAVGKWSAGDAASGFHTFTLHRSEAGWRIQSVK